MKKKQKKLVTAKLRTLVLNNQFLPMSIFPLYTIPAEDAVARYLNEKCEVVCWYDKKIQTPSRDDLYWPSVIVNFNANSFKKEVKLKKESLFYRDHCSCVYCGKSLTVQTLTYDHYIPRSKGGHHGWDNVVASCKDCNSKKDNNINSKEWKLKKQPWEPTFFELLDIRKKYPLVVEHEDWIQFLPHWAGDIVVKNRVQKDHNVVYMENDNIYEDDDE